MATTEVRPRQFVSSKSKVEDGEPGDDVCDGPSPEKEEIVNKDLAEPIKIKNMEEVNQVKLLKGMQKRFKEKTETWKRCANRYRRCSLALNVVVLIIQFAQIVLHDVEPDWVSSANVKIIQKGLIAMTTLIVTLHMKLKIKENAAKYRNGAKVYEELLRKTDYYIIIIESGGKVEGVADWLQVAIEKEDQFTLLLNHLSMKLE